jgi:cysteine-rich repeat protein
MDISKNYNKAKSSYLHYNPLIKIFFILTFFSFLIVFSINLIPNASADVISVNSGGSEQIVVNPDTYIEGFFTGKLYICGDGVIDTEIGEQCDDGNTASGDGCSSSCQIEAPVTPPGGGGGPGGGAGITQNIAVLPTQFTITLAVNTNQQQIIRVTNTGTSAATVTMSYSMFDNDSNPADMILMNTSAFILQPGDTRQIPVTFVALNNTGIFTGSIRVGSITIPVTVNVKTELLLFDSNIIVLNKDYLVVKGDDLKTRVTLIPLGDKERLDVTLDYTIRDYTGKIYLTQRETLLIQDRLNFDRNFGTGNLPVGGYVVGLELRYPNGVAPSSAHFEVVTRAPVTFGTIVFWLVIAIIIVIMAIVIIIIYRKRKKEQGVQ